VDVDFGDAAPEAVRAWADTLPEPLRAAGLAEPARLRVAGVHGPAELAALAESWHRHALMPTRFERAGLRLEQILRETAA
jgi:ABC-2 type transport system ATP-binding protein